MMIICQDCQEAIPKGVLQEHMHWWKTLDLSILNAGPGFASDTNASMKKVRDTLSTRTSKRTTFAYYSQ